MTLTQRVSEKSMVRLAQYWHRANLMHELVHTMREMFDSDLDRIKEGGHDWEFLTYLSYWLSGLFVVVEGFNKLKLKDGRVQKLFRAQLKYLKEMRHDTYHFSVDRRPSSAEMIEHLNWAEELHEAIGEHIRKIVGRKAKVEKFLEKRSRAKRVS